MVADFSEAQFVELISKARAGDSGVMEKILTASVPKIESWNRNWYSYLIRNRLSGRDLTQEVLLIASYSFEQFRGTSLNQWYGWLYKIHRNVVINLVDHAGGLPGNETSIPFDDDDRNLADVKSRELTPGSTVSLNEETERVRAVLQRLDSTFRIVLVGWMDGVTLEDQAKAMNLTVSKIRTLRLNALREFSSLWKNLRETA